MAGVAQLQQKETRIKQLGVTRGNKEEVLVVKKVAAWLQGGEVRAVGMWGGGGQKWAG